ncbi:hypothetical protein KKE78_05535 [Patescibacteria group bacterium]|nr:hypothetical protein [Patescibacteria group bacterium]
MRRFFTFVVILFLTLFTLHSTDFITRTFAEVACDPSACPVFDPNNPNIRSDCLKDVTSKCEAQLQDVKKKEKTLKSQLAIIDGQTQVTLLKIEETNLKIEKLQREISDLSTRIDRIGTTLDALSEILLRRIVQTYKYSNSLSTMDLLFSSHGFADLIGRLKYIQTAQAYDKQKLYELQATKLAYNDQKQDKQTRQTEAEKLNKDLENYKNQLAEQKKTKDELLRITKNDEAVYQARLAEAQKEISQIQRAASILISSEPKHVGKGEIVGRMGNTGYSFGAHLHFGVYNISSLSQYKYDSNYENPASLLSSQLIYWDTGCNGDPNGQIQTGTGSFQWPMSTSNLYISQGYGHTCYSDVYYHGDPHPAFDMYNKSDIFVKATDEGQAYFCRNCTGDGGNGVFIFHPNGKMTLYWHLQ